MSTELDFQLHDLAPADQASERAEARYGAGDLTVLAQHHTPNRSRSFVVAHDRSATWGVPGAPQIRAIKVTRDLDRNTFTFESARHSTAPWAQNWLIERGCPPRQIGQLGGDFMQPADDLTAAIEQQLRMSGSRYEVLDSYTCDYDPCETWTLARDSHAAEDPFRLFVEEGDYEAHTYTLREGAFADEASARQWLDTRANPLPLEHRDEDLRARAALTRSPAASAAPHGNASDHVTRATPIVRPSSVGRSL
ncbi:hypothetical protein ABH940_003459 [Streptacidiphilus sp. BW17]|jgi:hypothetical protein|uniref:glycosyl hydrolase n=1 Tax=Streptacidiphilus sp. BW17 TaxID=3156274 RepID=UPI0035197E5F